MEIRKAEPFTNLQTVEGIVSAYQQSFGGEPWNEGFACPACGNNYPLSSPNTVCPYCASHGRSVPLVEFWPRSRVMTDFYKEMAKPGAICVVAENSRGVEGFAWGYDIAFEPEIDQHLDAPGIHRIFGGEAFYLDECAVTPAGQGNGVGKMLVTSIFAMQGHTLVMLRTKENSRMYRLIQKIGGTAIMRISHGRVIMTCHL